MANSITRRFDGETYRWQAETSGKGEAEKIESGLRKKGIAARVTYRDGYYVVWGKPRGVGARFRYQTYDR